MIALSLRPTRRFADGVTRRAARSLSSAYHDPKTGSSYENYSVTSKTYDAYRAPIGLDVLRKAMADNAGLRSLSMSDLYLLDAGCGVRLCSACLSATRLANTTHRSTLLSPPLPPPSLDRSLATTSRS